MAVISNTYILVIKGKLQPGEVEQLKYILRDSLTGKIH